jgi:hypothetical protein
MKLTERQRQHRAYLITDHWKQLRSKAIERDGGKCLDCGGNEILQVHHLVYRERLEDGILEDVITLCKRCHRSRHGLGFWSRDFDELWIRLETGIRTSEPGREKLPTRLDFVLLMDLAETEGDHREVENMIRGKATMRIILASESMWCRWLKPDKRPARDRLWRWAERKANELKLKEIFYVR